MLLAALGLCGEQRKEDDQGVDGDLGTTVDRFQARRKLLSCGALEFPSRAAIICGVR